MSKLCLAIVLLICSAFAAPACAQAVKQKKTTKQSKPAASQSVKKIPVEIPITNQIYIQARLNNSEPMWFILDTGATWTILDVDKAKELNINSEGTRTLDLGQTNTVTTTFATDASLDISSVKVPVKELAVMPTKFRHAPQIVGLIGSDLFKRFVVEIDYQAKTITLFEPQTYKYNGRGQVLPFELIEEIPHIVVNISRGDVNALAAKVSVDTGASATVMLNAPFVEKNKLLETTEGTTTTKGGGLGGGNPIRRVRAKSVKIGNVTLDQPLITFSSGKGAADRRDGIIGNGLLDRFKIIVDYQREQLVLEPTDRMAVPTDFDLFLFSISKDGKDIKIDDVIQSGNAGTAGLKPGDALLAVDGKEVGNMSLIEIKRMFIRDGRERVLSVQRNKETLVIKLPSPRIL